jgi:hypothetical protein
MARGAKPLVAPLRVEPLIKLLPFQQEAFWGADDIGFVLWLWRRQAGKTTTMSALALRRMMERPWQLVTYASASIAVGGEMLIREAQIWREALDKWRRMAEQHEQALKTNVDELDFDAFCDLFEHGKVEAKLYHNRTAFSRTRLIAPNPATARGYSGFVMIDEIGFIRDMKDLWEAMEPIASRQADFRVVMATTPPADDAHYAYELSVPPEGMTFDQPQPAGHWYDSQANVRVHRVDVWDAWEAGVKLYDLRTRKEISPEESRAQALDRDAWDRNYDLQFKRGGAAAISLMAIHDSMARGRGKCLAAEDEFPPNWRGLLDDGPVAVGADPATTEKEKSNPFSITISQQSGMDYIARLIIRFKTADPEKAKAYLREACDLGAGRRLRRLVVDATSERYWAAEVKRELSRICPVVLVVSSEKTTWLGEEMLWKQYLGNLVVNTMDDGHLILPECRWLKDDFRLVFRERGSFNNHMDSAGNHGDTFDSTKNSLHGLISKGGPTQAAGVQVGTYGRGARDTLAAARPDHSGDTARAGALCMP